MLVQESTVAHLKHQICITSSCTCEADILTKAITSLENKPHTEPLRPLQERFLTCAIKHKLQQSNSGNIICKTGGQPLHLNVIPKSRKESPKASKDTLKKRVNVIKNVRKVTVGGHDTEIQQAAEITILPINRRTEVCSRAGIKRGNYLSTTMGNVMKSVADFEN